MDTHNLEALVATLTNTAIPVPENQPIQVSQVEATTSWGFDTVNYLTTWDNGSKLPVSLRLYHTPVTYWHVPDDLKGYRTWSALRRLRLETFPAPHPLARGSVEGTDFVMWYQEMGQPITIENVGNYVPKIAGVLADLHALDHSGLIKAPLYQATISGTLVRMLLWAKEMGNPDLRKMVQKLKAPVGQMKAWPHRMLHGNLHYSQILVRNGQISQIVNWENAAIGDPRWDVMTAAHWLRNADPSAAEQLINWYENLSSKQIDQRPAWYALISVRLWALKSWLKFAVSKDQADPRNLVWTEDIDAIRQQAEQDLAALP